MKTLYFFIAQLVLSFAIFSCSKNNSNTGPSSLKAKFMATTTVTAQQNSSTPRSVSDSVVIASLDIKSYNAKTGEIVFDKQPVFEDKWENYRLKLNMYKNDTLLFRLTLAISIYSFLFNEPVIYYSFDEGNAAKWYILDGYPWGEPINSNNGNSLQKDSGGERAASVKEIQSAWNVFINELKREGKYIE